MFFSGATTYILPRHISSYRYRVTSCLYD